MIGLVAREDAERFRAVVVSHLGLQFEEGRLGFLAEVLQRRVDATKAPVDAYLEAMEEGRATAEVVALAQELTVNETYFFRNSEQFRAFGEQVLPELLRARHERQNLRVLSAGCASGEEAYTISIVAQEAMPDPSWDLQVIAVDVNSTVLTKARLGRYSDWVLRETPDPVKQGWFHRDGRDFILHERARTPVRFEQRNLVAEDPQFWAPASYDIVFCRNVMMYFSPDQMRSVVARVARALVPGGYLFLGHAETLRGCSDDFHLCHSHGTFYYRRKETHALRNARPVSAVADFSATAAPPEPPAGHWFDKIRAASERIEALVPAAETRAAAISTQSSWDLAPTFDLIGQERFGEALACVRTRPAATDDDPDTLLLEATLQIQNGDAESAQATCHKLLSIDDLNAGAHYVLGLCLEGSDCGSDAAAEHYRTAIYLDAAFAMPHLHLGLIARRKGDIKTARRELAQALALLPRDDASRLLLFGGGFTRQTLVGVAEAALRDCGGRR